MNLELSSQNEYCEKCPSKGLEGALPIALQKNQEALNSISRLYSRVSAHVDPSMEIGHLVNRTKRIKSGAPIPLPLITDSSFGSDEQSDGVPDDGGGSDDKSDDKSIDEDEQGMPPIWEVTLSAAKKIFYKVIPSGADLVWAASSINPPTSTSVKKPLGFSDDSPLGFEDVVILHSNPGSQGSRPNGRRILEEAQEDGFRSLSRVFFPQLAAAQGPDPQGMLEGDKDMLMSSDFGIWICPTPNPSAPQRDLRILKVECNRSSLPPEIPKPEGLLQHTYQSWREWYAAPERGSLEKYFAAFNLLAVRKTQDEMHLLFCPVLYVDRNNEVAAGANISLGIIGALNIDQVHEIMMCLKALQAGLASTTAGFSQAQERIRELDRSRQMLLLLQRPLDALTKAFNKVQSEAQEMQSVLNAPEVALFRTHKLLTDLFTEDREISISRTLTLRAKHSWAYKMVPDEQLRMAYAYAICRIFGKEGELQDCQNADSIEATAQQVLRLVHSGGAHGRLLSLLSRLLITKRQLGEELFDMLNKRDNPVFSLIESLGQLPRETAEVATKRKGRSLDKVLKPVVFTPFKSFGKVWPTLAFEVALFGDRYEDRYKEGNDAVQVLRLDPSETPFPQHAILEFITLFCSLSREGNPVRWEDIEFSTGNNPVEIRLKYIGHIHPYEPFIRKKRTSLPDYLKQVIHYRVDQSNSGDFLNCFGSLVRKGLGVAWEDAQHGEWELMKDYDEKTTMICLGKVGQQNNPSRYERFFEIRQENAEEGGEGGQVIICWSEGRSCAPPSPGSNGEHASVPQLAEFKSDSVKAAVRCALFDHKNDDGWRAQWSEALTSLEATLVGTNDNWEDATILLLHENHDTKDMIKRFLGDARSGKRVILISTTGNPHPGNREALQTEFGGAVQWLDHPGYEPSRDITRQRLRKCLGV